MNSVWHIAADIRLLPVPGGPSPSPVDRVVAAMGRVTEAGAETFSFSPESEMPELGVGFRVDAETFEDAWGFAPWVVELLGDLAGPAEVVALRICDDERWRRENERGAGKRGFLRRFRASARWFRGA
ncbi:hypothetical protein [Sinomonas sp. R1AF57]|uniref:hypothetical protein n=1 Tax=Sinomonas sp. R1AF57 TaxID=2020377 RepID=UPI000B602FBD|nr:hypothetical protein [Sinomonas sp. R1AF57]ASN51282.1 hypothetical protein CGQ25_03665 [Sinomonas sp. R1AF57]